MPDGSGSSLMLQWNPPAGAAPMAPSGSPTVLLTDELLGSTGGDYLSQSAFGPSGGGLGGGSSSSQGGGRDIKPLQSCMKDPPAPKPLRIRASLFFDGTGNNRVNIGLGPKASSEASYNDGLSNIAKLETAGIDRPGPDVDKHFTVYTEGIGTVDRGSDVPRGMAVGKGWTGIVAKVERGIAAAISNIRAQAGYAGTRKIELIHLDTFGFSRGAAAARHCIWKCMQEAEKTLKNQLKALGFTVDTVVVKFVGLYDTVASYGLDHDGDTAQLHLDAISIAEKVVQLAAAEEHRANFRLTNIASAGKKGEEYFLPGVHSDVGGGYADKVDEVKLQVFDLDTSWLSKEEEAAIQRERRWLIASGWYRASELETSWWNEIKATRRGIPSTYSRIPLQIMARFARKHGVLIASSLEGRHPIPAKLSKANTAIQDYVAHIQTSASTDWFKSNPAEDPAWHVALRHDYLHFSAFYGGIANTPQWTKDDPVRGRRQRVIQNG
jgi:hypothetical protein